MGGARRPRPRPCPRHSPPSRPICGPTPTRVAIIRAYGRFERALAGARAPRAVWQTPAEFMGTTLARLPVAAAPVRRLTALFEIARFSAHPVGAEARDTACDCLDQIGAALEEDATRAR